jgi:hypothetical protein
VVYHYSGWETGGPTPWERLGDQFVPLLEPRAVALCDPADAAKTVRHALSRALSFVSDRAELADDHAHQGAEAFSVWANALEKGTALRDHHSFCARAWSECREQAVAFLLEAKQKLPGRCDAQFDEAIAC